MHPSGEASRTVQALVHACEIPLLEPLNQTYFLLFTSAHLTVVLRHGSRVERFDRVPSSRLTRLHRTHWAETDRIIVAWRVADLTLESTFASYTIVACYENLARMATRQYCARGLTRGTSALFPHRVRLVTRVVSYQRSSSDTEVGVAVQQVVHLGSRDFVGIGDMVSGMLKDCALCAACARQAFTTCVFTVVHCCSYVHAKGDYRSEELDKAATTALDILLSCQQHSAAQVHLKLDPSRCCATESSCLSCMQARWASSLTQVLRTWRHKLTISIEWKPIYTFLQTSVRSMLTSYEGQPKHAAHYLSFISSRLLYCCCQAMNWYTLQDPTPPNCQEPAATKYAAVLQVP